MPRRNATPKQTSGGGFLFENEVVAYSLVHLLARSSPFDPPGGVVEQVKLQAPATIWHLNDVVVTVKAREYKHTLAFSIKSNVQVTRSGFPADFVTAAWEQLLHDSSPAFAEKSDYLGLIDAQVDPGLQEDVSELLRRARDQSPDSLATELSLEGRANETVRRLFSSANCPPGLAERHGEVSAGRLLRRMVWVPLDFENQNSIHRSQALDLCQDRLESGSRDEAGDLWDRLNRLADRHRRSGGEIDLGKLVDELRGFKLKDFPDYRADWERITEDTRSALGRVRSRIGGHFQLARQGEHADVNRAFGEVRAVALLGGSGYGKSVIAKVQAELALTEGHVLWLDAERLSARALVDWQTHLGLSHSFSSIIRTVPTSSALLVLDGLDRLYEAKESAFATVAEFLRAARLEDDSSRWRVLITCIPEAWERVQRQLVSHQVLPRVLRPIKVGIPAADELKELWRAFPQLRSLSGKYYLSPVLLRPKVLDLLATHSLVGVELEVFGESDLARWFWNQDVECGSKAAVRAEAARRLAQYSGDKLVPEVTSSEQSLAVGSENLSGLDDLVQSRLLRRVDGRVSFDHDLYADWIRTRHLVDLYESGKLFDFLSPRLNSPVWHRAIRLYGIHLLEQSNSLEPWSRAFEEARKIQGPAATLAQDLLLEATAFASGRGAESLQDDLWPRLVKQSGKLLERLLMRFLQAATFANPLVVEAVRQQAPHLEIYVASAARIPYPFYWSTILHLLHRHRAEIPLGARGLVARVADLWLRSTGVDWALRKEAASLAVALGEALVKDKEERDCLCLDEEADRLVYRAVLACGHEEPEATTQILLEASGKRPCRYERPPLTEEELTRLSEKRKAWASVSSFRPQRPLPEPWPHGPAFRVDGSLQKVVLEPDAVLPLAVDLPAIAREILLAHLISEPEHRKSPAAYQRLALEAPQWNPPFYTHGPFRGFLLINEAEAVTAILHLVNQATERWTECLSAPWSAQEDESSSDQAQPPNVSIEVGGRECTYVGDVNVFAWSLTGADPGGVIGSALSALEKHLYDRVDAGGDVSLLIERLLAESSSLAVVGLLSILGRRHPNYLRGPLRGLLVSPHVMHWTLAGGLARGWERAVPPEIQLPPALVPKYRAWHQMPHRKTTIRDLAVELLLNDVSLQEFFAAARLRLTKGLEPGGPYESWSQVEDFAARLDPSNYHESESKDGEVHIRYSPPADLRQKHAQAAAPSKPQLLLMSSLVECRLVLEGAGPIPDEALEEIWNTAQALQEGNDPDLAPLTPQDAATAAAAVLVRHGSEWLLEYPERAVWARRVLIEVALEAKGPTTNWEAGPLHRLGIAARGIPSLWAIQLDDRGVREAIAKFALYGDSRLVAILAAEVATLRERLSEDHRRILHLVLKRAAIEDRWERASHKTHVDDLGYGQVVSDDPKTLLRNLEALEQAFIEKTLPATVPGLDEIAPLLPLDDREVNPHEHRRSVRQRPIDKSLLVAAYRGVPTPRSLEDEWFKVWEGVVLDSVHPLAPAGDESRALLADGIDAWGSYLMARIAGIVAELENPVAARRLWKPIIDLGAFATEWVSQFVHAWIAYALDLGAVSFVAESWLAMIDAGLASPRWRAGEGYTAGSRDTGELWQALFGFDAKVWTLEHRLHVRRLKPRFATWAESHLGNSENVCAFAHFLSSPAAAEISLDGLTWIDQGAPTHSDYFWGWSDRSKGVEEALCSLLVRAWTEFRDGLRRNEAAYQAFRNLLQVLQSRQYQPALELAERVGSWKSDS